MFSRDIVLRVRLLRSMAVSALCLLAMPSSEASDVTISARYQGDALGRFENTTPEAGFCRLWPSVCKGFQAFTVSLPISYEKVSTHRAAEPREQFFIKLPARRTVQVVHDKGIDTHELIFEITHSSQRVQNDPGFIGTANPIFTAYVRGGCNYVRTHLSGNRAYYLWATRVPENPAPCYSSGDGGQPGDVYLNPLSDMGIGYKLTMPSPLRMKQGIYRGSTDFTVGPGGDFDLGDGVSNLNTPVLKINFELEVQHAFVVDFPPGSERAVLLPPGGWQRWLGGGAPPARLERSLPLRLWSTGPFKVYKTCQYSVGASCGIRNSAGHEVPVDVALSLPPGVSYGNAPVRRLQLPTGREAGLAFETAMPVGGQAGQLHFDVLGPSIRTMLDYPGSTYEGQVTVVFDADV